VTLKWGKDAQRSKADLPRKPRGGERPGHAHEQVLLTGVVILIGAFGVLGFASWNVDAADVTVGDASALGKAGLLIFGTAALLVVSLGLWLFLDIRTPLLLIGGATSVVMVVVGLQAPVFWLLAPFAFCGFWAGLSALEKHPRDRWTAVVVAMVLSIGLGRIGALVFAPVALAATFVPMLEFGDSDESETDDD
jgi:hypothetical protein